MGREERGHRAFRAVEGDDIATRLDVAPAIGRWSKGEMAKQARRDAHSLGRIGGEGAGDLERRIGHPIVDVPADRMDDLVALRL